MSDPDWASPGAATTIVEPEQGTTFQNNNQNGNPVQRKDRSKLWHRLISFLLIGLCASMVALGISVILELTLKDISDLTDMFIAFYMVLFGLLLFMYEMMWWCTVDLINKKIRRNFGFMYKVSGKGAYIIFVALLCLGIDRTILGKLEWLQWFTGISWGVTGFGLEFLVFFRPNLFRDYQSPTGGYLEDGAGANENIEGIEP